MRKKNLKQKLYPKINNISGILISTGTCGLKENSEMIVKSLNELSDNEDKTDENSVVSSQEETILENQN